MSHTNVLVILTLLAQLLILTVALAEIASGSPNRLEWGILRSLGRSTRLGIFDDV